MTAAPHDIQPGAADPADVWDAYCAETPAKQRSPQGALAFGFAAAATPPASPARSEVLEAVRKYCHRWSPAAIQMSHGEERIYYAGLSVAGLVDAICSALSSQGATREAVIEECARIVDARARHWAEAFGGGMHEHIAMSIVEECESIAKAIRALCCSTGSSEVRR